MAKGKKRNQADLLQRMMEEQARLDAEQAPMEGEYREAQADRKFELLTEHRRLRDTHLEFSRFCEVVLRQAPPTVCAYGRLPSVGQMRLFAFYLATTRKGASVARIKLTSLLGSMHKECAC